MNHFRLLLITCIAGMAASLTMQLIPVAPAGAADSRGFNYDVAARSADVPVTLPDEVVVTPALGAGDPTPTPAAFMASRAAMTPGVLTVTPSATATAARTHKHHTVPREILRHRS